MTAQPRPLRLPPSPRRRVALIAALALLVPALSLAPVLARGEGGPAGHRANAKKADHAAAYGTTCTQGNAKYAARDFDGAIQLYKKAIELSPQQGLAHYLLGEAEIAAGNLPEAEAAWTRAGEVSVDGDPALHAKVLFVTADLKERQRKWDDAKAAWQAYMDWASRYPSAGVFPATARSRMQVLDTVIKQDKTVEVVRQRIAASADGGVLSDPSKSPPSK